jgi:hypothetical protein
LFPRGLPPDWPVCSSPANIVGGQRASGSHQGERRADFLAPAGDPTAKDDLVYTLVFFEPRGFYQVSPHGHTCQSQPDLLTAKNIGEYLTGFTAPLDSIKPSAQTKLVSHDVTVSGLNYAVLEADNTGAETGKEVLLEKSGS